MYTLLVYLSCPHTVLALLSALALYRLWKKRLDPKPPLRPLLLLVTLLSLLSTDAAAYLACLPLEAPYPPPEGRPEGAEAIVVFSAGVEPPSGPRLWPEMNEESLHRCLEAARLYALGAPCPVVVSGGKVDPSSPGPSFASVLGEFLQHLGVRPADLVLEEDSRTTYENAVETARILRERGIRQVALVVDAIDMPRAAACLRKQGIEVLPAACHFRATGFPTSAFSYLPCPGGAAAVERAWHEWLGMLWYRLRGRL